MKSTLMTWWLLGALLCTGLACGETSEAPQEACMPGTSAACTCPDGRASVRTCAASGEALGPCACDVGTGGQPGTGGATGGGAIAGSGGTGGGPSALPTPSTLPEATMTCPTLVEGEVMFGETKVRVWVDSEATAQQGPLILYWHGTCSNPLETSFRGLGDAAIQRIKSLGGMVAAIDSPYKSPDGFCPVLTPTERCPGTTTGNGVWCREDYAIADAIVACAIDQVGIDPRRIHTAGMSAGGVMAAAYGYARSSYLASVVTYSGGGTSAFLSPVVQDPSNKYAVMIVHGGSSDGVGIANFQTIAGLYQDDLEAKGQFSFICDHGMGHTIPVGIGDSAVQFFLDHPFGVAPEPYEAALPATFPDYCAL